MDKPQAQEKRDEHAYVFRAMLEQLGRRNYDGCAVYLSDDVYADWPYRPMPNLPDHVTGKQALIDYFRGDVEGAVNEGLDEFTPLSYEIDTIYELLDPATLIAEYQSHAKHIPSGKPYHNKYLAIVRFRDGKICFWREYVNPAVIYEIYNMVRTQADL